MSGGEIVWGGPSDSAATEEESKPKAGSSSSSSKKKSKAAAADAAVSVAPATGEAHRVLVLRALVEAVVQRRAAFSAVLLSEAVRALSPSTCAVLLRVFALALRGLSARTNDTAAGSHSQDLGRFGDDQIRRAVTWMEALLDAHFSATALQAAVHAPTRRALTVAMQVVSGAEVAAEQVEGAMGLWTHITRVAHHGSEQTKPIPGLYKVEQLSF